MSASARAAALAAASPEAAASPPEARPGAAARVLGDELRQTISVLETLLDDLSGAARVAEVLVAAFRAGRKAVLFGNGGSAADAQHVAAELIGRFRRDRAPLPALALSTDTSVLTSIGNDTEFALVFARQAAALLGPGDVAIGISTSGRSPNVLQGIIAARAAGATTVGFTGQGGGHLRDLVDVCFVAPSHDTARIQEAHLSVWHGICELIERELFGPPGGLDRSPPGMPPGERWEDGTAPGEGSAG